jgi:transposase-like protein
VEGLFLLLDQASGLTSLIYAVQVSKDTISRIADRVAEEMQAWTQPVVGTGLRRRSG